tara:strand:+ start:66 stop:458 length:393 start_codon:yes stop_codon:yes gene_type:complete
MSQDIKYIKEQIKSCEEIDSVYELNKGDIVKYITIKDGMEYFYTGGRYLRMIDNGIKLETETGVDAVPITIINKDGKVLYRTRFFVESKNIMDLDIKYEGIIKNQQNIINYLTKEVKRLKRELKESKKLE